MGNAVLNTVKTQYCMFESININEGISPWEVRYNGTKGTKEG